MNAVFLDFWRQHPALLYGTSAFLGIQCALGNYIAAVPLILLCFPFFNRRSVAGLLVFLSFYAYTSKHYQFPNLSEAGLHGTAYIDISSLSKKKTHFGNVWVYQGTLAAFFPDNKSVSAAKNIPYKITLSQASVNPPPANCSYQIEGVLKINENGSYLIKVDKNKAWNSIKGSWSLAEFRFRMKNQLSNYISHHIKNSRSAIFLTGIATGNFDDRLMSYEFGRFGLQHIMAISGFHFAIIAAILSIFLRCLIPKRLATGFLIFFA